MLLLAEKSMTLDFGLQVGEATGPESKKCKVEVAPVKPKVEETASDGSAGGERGRKQAKGKSSKSKQADDEPPRDYVHVRARRGQATDSHSLAERVILLKLLLFFGHLEFNFRKTSVTHLGLRWKSTHCPPLWVNRLEERR